MSKIACDFIKGLFLLAVAVFFMSAAAGSGFGQMKTEAAAGGPSLLRVTMVTVRPDMVGEFRSFIRDEYNPAMAKGGVTVSYAWETAGFGDVFKYYFVSPIKNFAEYDGMDPIGKALGPDAVGAFFKKAGTMVSSVHTYAMVERQDLSYVGKMSGPPKMGVVISIKVGQGHEADFENFLLNDYLPAFKKSDAAAFLVHQTVFGGDPNEYVIVGPMENFADLDKGHPIARVIGRDGFKKLMQKLPVGSLASYDVSIMRLNPTLSIIPGAKK